MYFVLLLLGCYPEQGIPGPAGPAGPPGLSLPAPSLSVLEASTQECADGGIVVSTTSYACASECVPQTTLLPVCNGATGIQGMPGATIIGPPGASGPAGLNGTTITVVQLCPGMSTYPGVFVEDALCVDNELYGAYSIPGAFLTALPDGEYTSQGIGSACNLIITGCNVTH